MGAPEFFRSLIGHMSDGVCVMDTKGTHIVVNRALCKMTGYAAEELMGRGAPYPYWLPSEASAIAERLQRVREGDTTPIELTYVPWRGLLQSPTCAVALAGARMQA